MIQLRNQREDRGLATPGFREDGWLPEGHHRAAWDEVEAAFGGMAGTRRGVLMDLLSGPSE